MIGVMGVGIRVWKTKKIFLIEPPRSIYEDATTKWDLDWTGQA
jgi:hypothetical protein